MGAELQARATVVQDLWSREQFQRWLSSNGIVPLLEPPFLVLSCRCGGINCHGWRLVVSAVAL